MNDSKFATWSSDKFVVLENDCWEWVRALTGNGYGAAWYGNKQIGAHVAFYLQLVGPIPEGLVIDHECHNIDDDCLGGISCPHRRCVNPQHLILKSQRSNLLAGKTKAAENAAKTKCPSGHPYSPPNTAIREGRRFCMTCQRERAAEIRSRP